ncbi:MULTISPECIES: hypothetical protein [Larkinella]|uniref:Uncharacterized protein n=1 Tax=Larkinella punicea TaxID=2315727 RepID=A0A368JJ42_9BACT|nr:MULTISPECIES: hypothetical protein [Larkinella]RCR67076.1 hypothetical protein DUE52_23765 [Larkinella punicea]
MSNFTDESENFEMAFVINLADGTGREFYMTDSGAAVALDAPQGDEPMILRTDKLIEKNLINLKKKFPATCKLYAVELREFEHRRQNLRNSSNKSKASE